MPSTESTRNTEELAAEIHAIRADIQNLTSTAWPTSSSAASRTRRLKLPTRPRTRLGGTHFLP
jgi:hypothetical protein